MASFTAQMLVGKSHPHHGGINPTHYLFLSENSRPAWILVPQNFIYKDVVLETKITWIPTLDSMLEDAFLMIALYVIKDKEVIKLAKQYFSKKKKYDWGELYKDIRIDDRFALYEKCRKIKSDKKIVITVLEGSTLMNHLKILKDYNFTFEICLPIKKEKKEL